MSKKKKAGKTKGIYAKNKNLIWSVITAVVIVGGYFYFSNLAAEYDLAQIGKGQNVVVQVHDPN